jgi:hypothetical protein
MLCQSVVQERRFALSGKYIVKLYEKQRKVLDSCTRIQMEGNITEFKEQYRLAYERFALLVQTEAYRIDTLSYRQLKREYKLVFGVEG